MKRETRQRAANDAARTSRQDAGTRAGENDGLRHLRHLRIPPPCSPRAGPLSASIDRASGEPTPGTWTGVSLARSPHLALVPCWSSSSPRYPATKSARRETSSGSWRPPTCSPDTSSTHPLDCEQRGRRREKQATEGGLEGVPSPWLCGLVAGGAAEDLVEGSSRGPKWRPVALASSPRQPRPRPFPGSLCCIEKVSCLT